MEGEYVFGELDTRDGDGWRVTVDGDVVATAEAAGFSAVVGL